MRDQSLRGHVGNLEQQGEMTRFDTEVDPHENLSALGWKTYDQLGKSSLFTNLKGFPGWTVCNQIVTDRKKWSIAIGVDESELIPTLVDRIRGEVEPVMVDAADAPVKEVILTGRDADLTKIPAMWTSENDPGSGNRNSQRLDPPPADPDAGPDRVFDLSASCPTDLPDVSGTE